MTTRSKSLFVTILLVMVTWVQISAQTQNYLTSSGNKLYDSTGKEVRLTGVNWFGFETALYSPHGIWVRDMKSVLQQIKDLGFNTIRVPWCNEMLNPESTIDVASYGSDPYTGVSPMNEEETLLTKPIELMDVLVDWCQENNIKIVLDNHSRAADAFLEEDFWYTAEYSEERWINDWVFLADRYKGKSAVVGMDLNNEPHGSTWGNSNAATDWNKAAERCGNAVLEVNPEVLIIVEGVGEFEGDSYWWGGQLKGAEKYPIVLSNPEKLMYSAHEYGPEVSDQDWFNVPDFPNNMPGLWEEHFHYLYENNASPIFIGEFGIKNQDAFGGIAYTWFTEFMDFAGDIYSWTFWSMNPNSGDTGGILQDDWKSVNQWKLDVLTPHLSAEIPNVVGDVVVVNQPPVAQFTGGSIDACEAPEIASFDASTSSDPDGDNLTYSWDFGDGTTGEGLRVTHDYGVTGLVNVTLTVSDGELEDSITSEITLLPSACAEPNIDALSISASVINGIAPLTVDFESTVSVPRDFEIDYVWDFKNGNTATTPSASTVYNVPGNYEVTLTAEGPVNTVIETILITVTATVPNPTSNLVLHYKNARVDAADNALNPHFEIVNNAADAVAYESLSIRYWFTSEGSNALNFWCDWAQLGTGNVQGNFGVAYGMNYLEITFNAAAGSLLGNSSSGQIQNRVSKVDWSNFDENDDYSYDASKISFTEHDRVTLYQNSVLVFGAEPAAAGTKLISDKTSFVVYPNPASDQLFIENETSLSNVSISIYDLNGKVVTSVQLEEESLTTSIDVSSLDQGIYLVKIESNDSSEIQLFTVK